MKRLQLLLTALYLCLASTIVAQTEPATGDNFQVGGNYYEKLEEAAAVVEEGGTITMTQDVEIDYDVELNFNKAYTIDLGGKTLTGNGNGLGTLVPQIGTIMIQNGTIIADFNDGVAIQIFGGSVILDNLTINATKGTGDMENGADAIEVFGGKLSILSGDYTARRFAVLTVKDYYSTVTITSGHFKQTGDLAWGGCLYNYGSGSIKLAGGSEANPLFWLNNSVAKEVAVTVPTYAERFQVGSKGYHDFKDALSAVPEEGTITLLTDIVMTTGTYLLLNTNKTYTFDLDGHALTSSGDNVFKILQVQAGTVTIRNGSITNSDLNGIDVFGGNVILEDLTVRAENEEVATAVYVEYGTASILSGDYYGALNAVFSSNDAVITLTSGHFTCQDDELGYYALHRFIHENGEIVLAPGSYATVANWLNSAKEVTVVAGDFYPVTNITGISASLTVGEKRLFCSTHSAPLWTVVPANATNKTVAWDGVPFTTEISYAYIDGELVQTTNTYLQFDEPGTYTLTATITDGLAPGRDYTQDFTLTVAPASNPTYGISIGTFTGGSVSADKTSYEENELVTLTIFTESYVLEHISAHKTDDETTIVVLSGTDNTRTFTMPAYGVTVVATFSDPDEAVNAAKELIETAAYTVAQAMANTETAVQSWLVGQINALPGMDATGITVTADDITLNSFTAAVEGTSDSPPGTNGDFTFTVSLVKGTSNLTTESIPGTITAIPATPPSTYAVSIAVLINGTITADPENAEAGEIITLTVQPASGYELNAITAYRTGMPTITASLSGTANTRTFEMPDYDVTVSATFNKTQAQSDKEAVEVAVTSVEGGTYNTAQATANDAESVRTWLVNTLNVLFGQSHNVGFRSETSIIGDVVVNAVAPAISGTENTPAGSNGNFTFTVTLTKGSTTLTTAETQGTIIATPYAFVKRIELHLFDDFTVRITNTGNTSTGDLSLVLSGANADAFILPAATLNSLPVAGETEITVQSADGLTTGTYTATLTVSGDQIEPVSVEITHTVTSPPTGIDDIPQAKALKVWTENGLLHVSGLTPDKPWSIYNVSGMLVHRGMVASDEALVSLPARGIYIVISGNHRIKAVY